MHEQNKDNWKDIYGIVQEKHKFKYLCQVHNFKKNSELLLQYIVVHTRQITVKLVN